MKKMENQVMHKTPLQQQDKMVSRQENIQKVVENMYLEGKNTDDSLFWFRIIEKKQRQHHHHHRKLVLCQLS